MANFHNGLLVHLCIIIPCISCTNLFSINARYVIYLLEIKVGSHFSYSVDQVHRRGAMTTLRAQPAQDSG